MKVSAKRCNQCLFSSAKVVSDKRKAAILQDCAQRQAHFICHKATQHGDDVCCRGFFDTMGDASQMVRIAKRLGAVRFVNSGEEKNDG